MADSRKNLQLLVFRWNHLYKVTHCITIHSFNVIFPAIWLDVNIHMKHTQHNH